MCTVVELLTDPRCKSLTLTVVCIISMLTWSNQQHILQFLLNLCRVYFGEIAIDGSWSIGEGGVGNGIKLACVQIYDTALSLQQIEHAARSCQHMKR